MARTDENPKMLSYQQTNKKFFFKLPVIKKYAQHTRFHQYNIARTWNKLRGLDLLRLSRRDNVRVQQIKWPHQPFRLPMSWKARFNVQAVLSLLMTPRDLLMSPLQEVDLKLEETKMAAI